MSEPARNVPEYCAQCGADIPPRARACPDCGADERTGWDDQSVYDGLDLPEETPPIPPSRQMRRSTWFIFIALIVIILLGVLGLGLG